MTSLTELLEAMPACFGEIFAERLLGEASPELLGVALADESRLKAVIASLPSQARCLLTDLCDLDGYCDWDVAARIFAEDIDGLRSALALLGEQGLVFQAGLSAHGALVLLPGVAGLAAAAEPPATLAWQQSEPDELVQAILMLNALRALKLKCRAEGDPFKKGWQQLDELLGDVLDVQAVFQDLQELGCLETAAGLIAVKAGVAADLAIAGALRYRIWRFLRSCQDYHGLEIRLARLLAAGPQPQERLRRGLDLYLRQHYRNAPTGEAGRLIAQWLTAGVLQTDERVEWLRLDPALADGMLNGHFVVAESVDQIIIKPDLEILVPRDFDPVEHVNLGEVADLARPDVMSLYRLNRASVARAALAGWTAETLLGVLERVTRHQLPDNVAQSVKSWSVLPGQARLLSGTFLFLDRARGELPGLELIKPGVYRLLDASPQNLKAQLDRHGIRLEGQTDADGELCWGRSLTVKPAARSGRPRSLKEGVYPYGMAQPLPVGLRGVEVFEQARQNRATLVILYPRRGYGEVQVRRVRPASIYMSAGAHFIEAYCEDSDQVEVFELGRIKAMLRA